MTNDDKFCGGLADADDAPALAPPSATPNWTENLWWIAHDGKTGMGLMLHLGSTRHDFNVVRQTVMLMLPDGRVATDVSVGGFREPGKVRGATLTMEYIKPFREWRVSSNGVTQLATLDELWNNSPRQGPRVPLRIDLKAECLGPVWEAGAGDDTQHMQQQEWAKSHYQQTIRLSGSIELDGVRHAFDATGVRDHSRGPRDFGTWHGHALCSAPFKSGRSFGLFSVFGAGGTTALRTAYVVKDGIMERGVPRAIPPLSRAFLGRNESFTLEIEVGGRVETIKVRTHGGGLLSMLAPYDVTPGIWRERPGGIALGEALASFEWDGETSYGIVERSAPADSLPTI